MSANVLILCIRTKNIKRNKLNFTFAYLQDCFSTHYFSGIEQQFCCSSVTPMELGLTVSYLLCVQKLSIGLWWVRTFSWGWGEQGSRCVEYKHHVSAFPARTTTVYITVQEASSLLGFFSHVFLGVSWKSCLSHSFVFHSSGRFLLPHKCSVPLNTPSFYFCFYHCGDRLSCVSLRIAESDLCCLVILIQNARYQKHYYNSVLNVTILNLHVTLVFH